MTVSAAVRVVFVALLYLNGFIDQVESIGGDTGGEYGYYENGYDTADIINIPYEYELTEQITTEPTTQTTDQTTQTTEPTTQTTEPTTQTTDQTTQTTEPTTQTTEPTTQTTEPTTQTTDQTTQTTEPTTQTTEPTTQPTEPTTQTTEPTTQTTEPTTQTTEPTTQPTEPTTQTTEPTTQTTEPTTQTTEPTTQTTDRTTQTTEQITQTTEQTTQTNEPSTQEPKTQTTKPTAKLTTETTFEFTVKFENKNNMLSHSKTITSDTEVITLANTHSINSETSTQFSTTKDFMVTQGVSSPTPKIPEGVESEILLFNHTLMTEEKNKVTAVIRKAWNDYTDRVPLAPFGFLENGVGVFFDECRRHGKEQTIMHVNVLISDENSTRSPLKNILKKNTLDIKLSAGPFVILKEDDPCMVSPEGKESLQGDQDDQVFPWHWIVLCAIGSLATVAIAVVVLRVRRQETFHLATTSGSGSHYSRQLGML
ncbi:hypothetical protein CAPTEDRAFT_200133 [Capitella teleta]|uniref:SEA domain-containing protein n=1 Tax=Capitella teleta TaxID=283909 RepID=R7VBJ4_CAPTE|nr:hypothetical protein CAPTEDRAFT_200133 [Capitella teleta]|eukprot:ELU13075.1 hypothetical protein CAPTEDRAFT_200133 [Capitella teleta]